MSDDPKFLEALDNLFEECTFGKDKPQWIYMSPATARRVAEKELGRKLTDAEWQQMMNSMEEESSS